MIPVPGLVIVREPGPRESLAVLHAPSGVAVICDLAGPATAQLAAEDLGAIEGVDWTMSAAGILDTADLLLHVGTAVDATARKHGGTTLGSQAVYAA